MTATRLKCRVCGSGGTEQGHLFRCANENCGAAHWDESVVRRLREQLKDRDFLDNFLLDAGLVHSIQGHSYVYILQLDESGDTVYVGQTNLHPFARYLNHIRGHKAARSARSKAIAIIGYEGPMSREEAIRREATLAAEQREEGVKVYGGH